MAKALNVSLAVTADTSQAKAQLQQLQSTLQQLSTSSANLKIGVDPSKIKEASNAALELSTHLKQATNVNTGTLNFAKLNSSIAASGQTLQSYGQQLLNLGPKGQQAFSQLATSIAKSEIPMKKLSGLLGNFGTVLSNTIRWQISSSAIHGFMSTISTAYNYAQDLNKSLTDIQIVTQASDTHMARFAEQANKAAKALSTTTTAYTKASLIYYQQGLSDSEVAARTETTIKMANVTGQSAQQVSDQMTAIWNNFAKGGQNLEYYADVITALGAATASSSEEISRGLEKFASIADTVGLSYENATAALATITATTRQSADTVGTGLRTVFSRLQSLSLGETLEDGVNLTKYSKALKTIGVDVLDVNGNLRSMDSILANMMDKWDGLTQAQKNALAQTVGGVRQYTTIMALMENSDFYKENLEVAKNSEGTVAAQQAIYEKSWQASSDRVKASLETIYSAVLNDQFFIGLNNAFSRVLTFINDLNTGLGGLKGTLTLLGSIIMKVFSNQMAQGLYKFGLGIKEFFTPAKALQQERSNFLQNAANSALGYKDVRYENGSYNVYTNGVLNENATNRRNAFADYLKFQDQYAKTAPYMTETDQMLTQMHLDNYEKVRSEWEASLEKSIIAQGKREDKGIDVRADAFNTRRLAEQAITQITNRGTVSQEQFDAYANFRRQGFINQWNEFDENKWQNAYNAGLTGLTDNLIGNGGLNNLSKAQSIMDEFTSGTISDVKSLTESLKAAGFDESDGGLIDRIMKGTAGKSPEQLQGTVKDIFKDYKSELKSLSSEKIGSFAESFGVNPKTLQEYVDALREEGVEAERTKELEKQLREEREKTEGQLKNKSTRLNITQGIVDIGRGITSLMSLNSQISSIIDSFHNIGDAGEDTSKRIKQGITAIAGAATSAGLSISALSKGLSNLGVSKEWSTGIAIAAVAITAIATALTEMYDLNHESFEEQQERLQTGLQQAEAAAKQAKQAYENLISNFSSHNNLLDELSNLSSGTIEFKEKLLEANDAALDLINTYGLIEGKDYTYGAQGQIVFTQQGKDTARAKAYDNAQKASQNRQMANILNKNNTLEELKTFNKRRDNAETLANWKTGGLAALTGVATAGTIAAAATGATITGSLATGLAITAGGAASTGVGIPLAVVLGLAAAGLGIWTKVQADNAEREQDRMQQEHEAELERLNLTEEQYQELSSTKEGQNEVLTRMGLTSIYNQGLNYLANTSGQEGITDLERAAVEYLTSHLDYGDAERLSRRSEKITDENGKEIFDFHDVDTDNLSTKTLQEYAIQAMGEDWYNSLTEDQQNDKDFLRNSMQEAEYAKALQSDYDKALAAIAQWTVGTSLENYTSLNEKEFQGAEREYILHQYQDTVGRLEQLGLTDATLSNIESTLASLDVAKASANARVEEAQEALAAAQAEFEAAKTRVSSAQTDLTTAQAEVTSSNAEASQRSDDLSAAEQAVQEAQRELEEARTAQQRYQSPGEEMVPSSSSSSPTSRTFTEDDIDILWERAGQQVSGRTFTGGMLNADEQALYNYFSSYYDDPKHPRTIEGLRELNAAYTHSAKWSLLAALGLYDDAEFDELFGGAQTRAELDTAVRSYAKDNGIEMDYDLNQRLGKYEEQWEFQPLVAALSEAYGMNNMAASLDEIDLSGNEDSSELETLAADIIEADEALQQAQIERDAAQAERDAAYSRVEAAEASEEAAKSELEEAKSELEEAETDLAQKKLTHQEKEDALAQLLKDFQTLEAAYQATQEAYNAANNEANANLRRAFLVNGQGSTEQGAKLTVGEDKWGEFSPQEKQNIANKIDYFGGLLGKDFGQFVGNELLINYLNNSEKALLDFLDHTQLTDSAIKNNSIMKKQAELYNKKYGTDKFNEFYQAAFQSMGGEKALFDEIYNSDEFADSLKELQKIFKKTGKIGADDIESLAEGFESLQLLLEDTDITAQGFADTLAAIEMGDINADQVSSGLLRALSIAGELNNNLSDVYGYIDNFKQSRSIMDIGKFYKGLVDQIESSQGAGMLLDEPLLQNWREIFGDESLQNYKDWVNEITSEAAGNLTPEEISNNFNERFADQIAAMQSMQEYGNLSGMYQYYFQQAYKTQKGKINDFVGGDGTKWKTSANELGEILDSSGKAFMRFNEETGQVVIESDKQFSQMFQTQADFIDYLSDNLNVPREMAEAMAAELAATDGTAHDVWGVNAAKKAWDDIIATTKEGDVVMMDQINVLDKLYGEFFAKEYGKDWKNKLLENLGEAGAAVLDLGKDFSFATASWDDLDSRMAQSKGLEGLDDYLSKTGVKKYRAEERYDGGYISASNSPEAQRAATEYIKQHSHTVGIESDSGDHYDIQDLQKSLMAAGATLEEANAFIDNTGVQLGAQVKINGQLTNLVQDSKEVQDWMAANKIVGTMSAQDWSNMIADMQQQEIIRAQAAANAQAWFEEAEGKEIEGTVVFEADYSQLKDPPPKHGTVIYEEGEGECFAAGTKILLNNYTTKNIEDIQIGDIIIGYNEKEKVFEACKVINTFIHNNNFNRTYKIYFQDGTILQLTPEHPILSSIGWKSLYGTQLLTQGQIIQTTRLNIGDQILGFYSNKIIVNIEFINDNQYRNVYNLEVEKCHTYIANGLIVHNDKASGYNNAKGFAGGKHSNGQYEGLADVGELGPELFIHDGQPYLAGVHGRTRAYVHKDDSIYTAAETKRILEENPSLEDIPGFSVGYNPIHWGSSGSNANAGNVKTSKWEPERYHLITRQLKDLQREYERLSKIKDNAYGTNKLEAIQAEIDATNELIEGQKALVREAEDYLAIDVAHLKDLIGDEFQIDENGNLTNFEELQKKYRKAAEEDKDEKAQDIWKALQQYEETIDKLQEANVEMQDLLYQEMELRLEKITTKVEMRIDFDEREIKLLDHYIKRIDDNIYHTAEVLALTEQKLGHINQKINDTKQGITELFEEMSDSQGNKITKEDGTSYTLEEWLAMSKEERDLLDINDNFGKQLEEYMDSLLDYIEELEEFKTKGVEEFADAFSELNDNVRSSIDLFDYYNQLLSSLKNITQLQGIKLSAEMKAAMKEIDAAMFNNTQNNIDVERENYRRLSANVTDLRQKIAETTDETLKKQWEEQLKVAEEELRTSEQNLLSLWETGLQQARDMFEAALQDAADEYGATIAGMYGTTDELQKAWDQQKKNDDFYVKDFEKYYQIQKLQRSITRDLDAAARAGNRQNKGLKKLYDDLNAARESGVELSSYDLDIFAKRYEYEKALMELEDARNNKSEVRLQRDANGNWGYVYTSSADEDDLIAKQQAVDDKFYELQKATQERVASLSDDMMSEITGVGTRLQELYSSGASEETITKYLEQESKYIENYRKALAKALEDAGMTEEEARSRYGNEGFDILDQFSETLLSSITGGNESLDEFFARVQTAMEGTNHDMEAATGEYQDSMDAINKWFNESGEDLATVIHGFASVISEESDGSLLDSKEQIQNAKDTFDEILRVATQFEQQFMSIYQPIIDANEQLVVDLLFALHALNREEYEGPDYTHSTQSIKELIESLKLPESSDDSQPTVTSWTSDDGGNDDDDDDDKSPKFGGCFVPGTKILMSNYSNKNIEDIQVGDFVIAYNEETQIYETKKVLHSYAHYNTIKILDVYLSDGTILSLTACHPILTTDGWKSLDHDMALYEHKIETTPLEIGQEVIGKDHNAIITDIIWREDIPNYTTYNITVEDDHTYIANGFIVHNMAIFVSMLKYASGGYTGEWGPGGKAAILHEKELVLNKDDTKNFLDATKILRTIDLQTNMYSKGLGNIITPQLSNMKSQELEQDVHIEANFPNVQNRHEIEAAFDNLINKATQYANRKNMSAMTFQDMYTNKF